MEDEKLVFYGFGEKRVLPSFKMLSNTLDTPITINEQEKKVALFNLTLKDIKLLENRLNDILINLKQKLIICNINFETNYKLDEISDLLEKLEIIQQKLIIEGNAKISIFTNNKKAKKDLATNKLNMSNEILKYQTEILSIKNEYDVLSKRKDSIKIIEKNEVNENNDALSRTINFYMDK